jgi:uncharacterized membrane protein (DUF485 family)
MSTVAFNWSAIDTDARFRDLHRRKSSFLWGLMAFSVVYYFALPIGAAYLTDLFKWKVWGVINFGLVFALSEFIVAWGIAWYYSQKAAEFDALAAEINRDAQNIGARP